MKGIFILAVFFIPLIWLSCGRRNPYEAKKGKKPAATSNTGQPTSPAPSPQTSRPVQGPVSTTPPSLLPPAQPPGGQTDGRGLVGEFFAVVPRGKTLMPSLEPTQTPFLRRVEPLICFSAQDNSFPAAPARQKVMARWSGLLAIPAKGTYRFYLACEGLGRLEVAGKEVLRKDRTPDFEEKAGTADLDAKEHPILLEFFPAKEKPLLTLGWSGPGVSKGVMAEALLRHKPEKNLLSAPTGTVRELSLYWGNAVLKASGLEEIKKGIQKDERLVEAQGKVDEARKEIPKIQKDLQDTQDLALRAKPEFKAGRVAIEEARARIMEIDQEVAKARNRGKTPSKALEEEKQELLAKAAGQERVLASLRDTVASNEGIIQVQKRLDAARQVQAQAEKAMEDLCRTLLAANAEYETLRREKENAERRAGEIETRMRYERQRNLAVKQREVEAAKFKVSKLETQLKGAKGDSVKTLRAELNEAQKRLKDLEAALRLEEQALKGKT